jgi:hypothetical protein
MSENALVLAVAMMFIGPALNPILGAKGLRVVSFCIGILLIVAYEWADLKGHIDPQFRSTLSSAASNAYVWLGMLGLTWSYLALSNLLVMRRPADIRISRLTRPVRSLPDSLQQDTDHLLATLKREPHLDKRRAQILHNGNDKCVRLAKEFSDILIASNWEQPSPPTIIVPNVTVPKGLFIRASRSDLASLSRQSDF